GFQVQTSRLLQKPKGKARNDAKSILVVNAAPRKFHRNDLLEAILPAEIRKVDRLVQNCRDGRTFFRDSFNAQGKGGQRELLIREFYQPADGLLGKNVFRKDQPHFDAGEADGRQNPGHKNQGDEAGEDQEEQIIDRKSTRLNSSHQIISYAVFCLKKKKKEK